MGCPNTLLPWVPHARGQGFFYGQWNSTVTFPSLGKLKADIIKGESSADRKVPTRLLFELKIPSWLLTPLLPQGRKERPVEVFPRSGLPRGHGGKPVLEVGAGCLLPTPAGGWRSCGLWGAPNGILGKEERTRLCNGGGTQGNNHGNSEGEVTIDKVGMFEW